MNPLTNVKNIAKLSETELKLGVEGKASWHSMYSHSAWIFIGGLAFELTEGDIICVFSQYGEVASINLVRDKETGKSKGYCFLCYEDQKSTILAVDNLNGIKLTGRIIRVDHCENYETPEEREKRREKDRKNKKGGKREQDEVIPIKRYFEIKKEPDNESYSKTSSRERLEVKREIKKEKDEVENVSGDYKRTIKDDEIKKNERRDHDAYANFKSKDMDDSRRQSERYESRKERRDDSRDRKRKRDRSGERRDKINERRAQDINENSDFKHSRKYDKYNSEEQRRNDYHSRRKDHYDQNEERHFKHKDDKKDEEEKRKHHDNKYHELKKESKNRHEERKNYRDSYDEKRTHHESKRDKNDKSRSR